MDRVFLYSLCMLPHGHDICNNYTNHNIYVTIFCFINHYLHLILASTRWLLHLNMLIFVILIYICEKQEVVLLETRIHDFFAKHIRYIYLLYDCVLSSIFKTKNCGTYFFSYQRFSLSLFCFKTILWFLKKLL